MNRKAHIRQVAIYLLYILFFSTLQVSFPQSLSFRGQVADFMIVLVILTGYFFGALDGAIIGFFIGLLRDIMSGTVIGVGALAFLYVGVLSAVIFSKRFHSRISLAFVQVIIMTIIYKLIGHGFFWVKQILSNNPTRYLSVTTIVFDSILPQIGVNLLITFPLIILLKYFGPYRRDYIEKKKQLEHEDRLWQIS